MRLGMAPWRRALHTTTRLRGSDTPLVNITNATFYSQYPSETASNNPPIFRDLSFSLPSNVSQPHQYWSVLAPSALSRTTFLKILHGQYICIPPTARSYPGLSAPSDTAIKYVGFDAERSRHDRGTHLSARYEAHREATDWTLWHYLMGQTELNATTAPVDQIARDAELLRALSERLDLGPLLSTSVARLSNGQTRRAAIAKALMSRPELLLLDGPFMGLDPYSARAVSRVLHGLVKRNEPRLVVSLRPEDDVPAWITHVVVVDDEMRVESMGSVKDVLSGSTSVSSTTSASRSRSTSTSTTTSGRSTSASTSDLITSLNESRTNTAVPRVSRDGIPADAFKTRKPTSSSSPVVEMTSVKISYGNRKILGHWTHPPASKPGLNWTIDAGERWAIFGPNGSGKTTLLSLMTSDHPQTYSLPIKLFGKSRLPSPGQRGISVFELQRRIGHSSPEVHAHFPKMLSLRRTLESAFADAPLAMAASIDVTDRARIDVCLRWFEEELRPAASVAAAAVGNTGQADTTSWADDILFRDLPFSSQRLALFLRATVAGQELVLLDEAFGGVDAAVRDKALLFLNWGQTKRFAFRRRSQRPVTAGSGCGSGPTSSPGHGSVSISVNGGASATECETVTERIVVASDIDERHIVMRGLSPHQSLVTISHARDDVPGCVDRWICLPATEEIGSSPRWGTFPGPLELHPECWKEVWCLKE